MKRKGLPQGIRHEVFKRDNFRCTECGATKETVTLHVDHFIPISKGGTDEVANLRTLCKTCNLEKSDLIFSSTDIILINQKTSEQTRIKFGNDISEQCKDNNPKTKMVTYDCGLGEEQTLLLCENCYHSDQCFSRFTKHIVELKH